MNRFTQGSLGILALGLLLACEAAGPVTPEDPVTTTALNHLVPKGATNLYFFLDDAGFPAAVARDGRSIEISLGGDGTGTFSLHPKSITGDGSFTIFDAAGAVEYSGTWSATRLRSFVSYGSTEVEPGFFLGAGKLLLHVELTGATGEVHKGILTLACTDFGTPPPGAFQGITLNITGVGRFSSPWPDFPTASGFTFFQLDI